MWRWLPKVWPTVLTFGSRPSSGTSRLRDGKQQYSMKLHHIWWLAVPFASSTNSIAVHSVNANGLLRKPRGLRVGRLPSAPWHLARDWRQGKPPPTPWRWNMPEGPCLVPSCLREDSVAVLSLWDAVSMTQSIMGSCVQRVTVLGVCDSL